MIAEQLLPWWLYELKKLRTEIELYESDADLWEVRGGAPNSAGRLVWHLIGNLNHFIGAEMGNTGYIRDKDNEWSEMNVPKEKLLQEFDKVVEMIKKVFPTIKDDTLFTEPSIKFMGKELTRGEALSYAFHHLGWHGGNIYSHRRYNPVAQKSAS